MVRDVRDDSALDSIWAEVVFTEARLLGDDKVAKTPC
jgi:hypothetical protein